MSMACFPSNPEDSNDEHLFGAEFSAQVELLDKLHRYHISSRLTDFDMKRHIVDLDEFLPPVEPKRFNWDESDQSVLQGFNYHEMEWLPKDDSATSVWVERVLVRYPQVATEEHGLVIPNDILIQVNADRYLLNDSGVQPYADGSALAYDESELRDPILPHDKKPNMFKVVGDYHWQSPFLSATMLQRILLEDSTYAQRE